jgi:putative acetyltransferase
MNEHLAGNVIRPATNADRERIKTLVFSVLAEYGLSPDPQSTDADLEDIDDSYIRAGGLFELIEDTQGQLLGTVGLYPLDAQIGELRKMYLAPHARGRGLGSAILKRTIIQARNLGFKCITLETASVLKEAVLLYTRAGFQEMPSEHLAARCDQAYILHL